ncbi:hypothetical protein M5689_022722 [Euphorbia peplus]|nr:hypothetical protein M5689_022722 [Euphorbia peplus]
MPRQQTVRASLMTFTDSSLDRQSPRDAVQTAVQTITKPHHMLNIVHLTPEKHPLQPQKVLHPAGQLPACQHLHQVAKIIGAMESDPADGFITDESGGHHELSEEGGVNAVFLISEEVNPLLGQEGDGIRGISVFREVKVLEVELPDEAVGGAEVGEVTVGVGEGEADLDEVEGVNVAFEDVVVVARTGVADMGGGWAEDDAGELSVHGDVREVVDEVADEVEFGF